jgi:uncharacterized membrane protein YbaN (DUF454 family)
MNAMRLAKPLYLALAWICVALGLVGIALPILPTTPFLLVSVWAFSRSSPEMAERLRNHPQAGRYIRDWQDYGVIPLTAKILATLMMTGAGVFFAGFSSLPAWLAYVFIAVMCGVGIYIWSRPSQQPDA